MNNLPEVDKTIHVTSTSIQPNNPNAQMALHVAYPDSYPNDCILFYHFMGVHRIQDTEHTRQRLKVMADLHGITVNMM